LKNYGRSNQIYFQSSSSDSSDEDDDNNKEENEAHVCDNNIEVLQYHPSDRYSYSYSTFIEESAVVRCFRLPRYKIFSQDEDEAHV